MNPDEIRARAAARHARLRRKRRDPRYARVIGRFVKAGLLFPNEPVREHGSPVSIGEALYAGEAEPRILELLPALVIKQPSLFSDPTELPDDLAESVKALRKGAPPPEFRGIPGEDQARWLTRVGRKGREPTVLKAFRMTREDLRLLRQLAKELATTETDVIRRGLRELAARFGHDSAAGP